MRIAVTGGTGFVGGKLIDLGLSAGHDIRALTRRAQPARSGLTWIRGELADATALSELCTDADVMIHVAGAINAPTAADFHAGNVEGTRMVLAAARDIPRFVHVSSIAAREPTLSMYGHSKAEGDKLVKTRPKDWVIIRPPAVYGPGDRETANVYKLIARGFALLPGKGRFSVIEVGDLAAALLALAVSDKAVGQTLEIDDETPGGLDHHDLAALIADALEKQPFYIPLPLASLKLGAAIDTLSAKLRGRRPALSFDRARYLAHPDWTADNAAMRALGIWKPRVIISEGIKRTADWYRAEGWI